MCGPDAVSQSRRWNQIAHRMGFPTAKHHLSFTLKHHYEKILQPYDIFKSAQPAGEQPTAADQSAVPEAGKASPDDPAKKLAGTRRVSRPQDTTLDHDAVQELADQGPNNKELKRLQFYGAGPKMSGYQENNKSKPRAKKILYDIDPLARYVCHICTKGDSEESMLLCDGCDDSYHTFCLNPPLIEIPKGDWRCPQCVAAEVEKPQEAFGFEQAQKEYTLQTFGEMADQFKSDYFNMPVHMIPTQTVEREFWRIVSSIDEDVCVEYGADLHTMDHGSGFPTAQSKNLSDADQEYVRSGWNLNNIAVLDDSILAHIKANISGMKVPWMYVGMCFSTFCWHNEDHWSYSINYLHWGEPKTWYGVSGLRAQQFEEAMKSAAPELFKAQPDLLHQLVTTMNPNVLMAAGVPIFRTDQHAGEFVVTLPRAYHTGFNQGFNFAEAVNFAPPDWLAIGRQCVTHYSQLRRFCVFSHDELVCSMALEPQRLSLLVASATYQNMLSMIDDERTSRTQMLEKGVRRAEREAFELLQDDERQCDYCKTTCFLSAITCPCSQRLVCLRHYDKLCQCPAANHVLKYRYTLQELPEMLRALKVRVESFDQWILRVKDGLEATGEARLGLDELKALLQEAEANRFPQSDLITSLALVIEEATKCSMVAQQLALNKVRTRSGT
ncbi:lysine-specific demethylase lid-like [Amphibalanus amphitrite]|uniref:lysine-specific demethylase lid-like n=1 Tax=Amphibalanus amphitrite TaxID=1232801 RepID=UPI001C91ABF7|nr:lysine-specific demethylase lid-like [Amphibalanus amphitrite]